MQELKVIGVESGDLLVVSPDGTRFRVPIDAMMQSKLRQNAHEPGSGPKLTPREVQSHIRSGMSAEDVAAITSAPLEYIQRFEGPVIAERDFMVQSALAVRVKTNDDADPLVPGRQFGAVIRERLLELGAADERWAGWKDPESGWIVKLSFTAKEVEHDARWTYDPRKQALSASNTEAVTLSENGDGSPPTMIPRLRAVSERHRDTDRFDSGAFSFDRDEPLPESTDSTEPRSEKQASSPITIAAVPRSSERVEKASPAAAAHNQTSDLLDALRRRRGERESAGFGDDDARAAHPSSGSIRVIDVPMDVFDENPQASNRGTAPQPTSRRKSRASMPSWDEIVFGARGDDDPA